MAKVLSIYLGENNEQQVDSKKIEKKKLVILIDLVFELCWNPVDPITERVQNIANIHIISHPYEWFPGDEDYRGVQTLHFTKDVHVVSL